MNFNFRTLVAAAAVATASFGAIAAPISLGTNPTPASGSVVGFGLATQPVTWAYSFILDSTTNFSDVLLSLRSTDPIDYSLSLTGPTPTLSPVAITGSTAIPAVYTFASLADGAYVLSITGTPTSSWSGSYGGSVTASVAAVPEPESIAMVLAGLGVAGFLTNRRKSV